MRFGKSSIKKVKKHAARVSRSTRTHWRRISTHPHFRTSLKVTAVCALFLGTFWVWRAMVRVNAQFIGPSNSAGSGNGIIAIDGRRNFAIGTSTTDTNTKFLIVASSTESIEWALRIVQPGSATPILAVRNDGHVGVGAAVSATSSYVVTLGGDTIILGSLATTDLMQNAMAATYVASGAFGANTGGGNYNFPSALSVGTTTIPTGVILYANGTSSWNGNVGIGTSNPAYKLDVAGDVNVTGSFKVNGATSGGFSQQVFTASSTFTIPSTSTTATVFKFTLIGGGGGGGATHSHDSWQCGGGGSGGATAIKYLTGLTPGNTITVTVGSGGAGGIAAAAPDDPPYYDGYNGSGGTSSTISSGSQSISTVTAGGGQGGNGSASSSNSVVPRGVVGGSASGGDINAAGGPGIGCKYWYAGISGGWGAIGGEGGSSSLGGGGIGGIMTVGSQNGGAGQLYGGGGGGGAINTSATEGLGGAGAKGIVIVEWIR